MSKQSNNNFKKFVDTFDNLARFERHNQTLMGIKKSEARVLLCIDYLSEQKEYKVNISNISKNLSITSPTITEIVKDLTTKGYLERHTAQNDKRFVEITLTDKGKKIVQDITHYYDVLFSGLIEKLGQEQSELLIELLNEVTNYFNEWYNKKN